MVDYQCYSLLQVVMGGKGDVVGLIDVYFLCWVMGSSYHDILGLLGSWKHG